LKKPTLKSATEITTEKKKAVAEANDDEAVLKNDASVIDVKSTPKGITPAHFIKFINELLDIMDEDGNLKGSYLRMDNASIHKSKPMIRKIEARGYRVMHSPFIRLELVTLVMMFTLAIFMVFATIPIDKL
jgi:hypothetical protein